MVVLASEVWVLLEHFKKKKRKKKGVFHEALKELHGDTVSTQRADSARHADEN